MKKLSTLEYGKLNIRFNIGYTDGCIDTIESCSNVFYEIRKNLNGELAAYPLIEENGEIRRLSKEEFLEIS